MRAPKKLTNQTAFEKSARHMLAQRRICDTSTGTKGSIACVYAGPDGQACAIGCLLPRRLAQRLDRLKLGGWISVQESQAPEALRASQLLDQVSDQLIYGLQSIHDRYRGKSTSRTRTDKREIRGELETLGRGLGLDTQFLKG